MPGPDLLGIDNVLFAVRNLDEAVAFYRDCGFVLKFRVDNTGMALFSIGPEEPGLLVRAVDSGAVGGGRLWVEVGSADAAAARLLAAGIPTSRIETMTGSTIEVADPSGNVVGFADYSRRPEMARKVEDDVSSP
jgi:catechol 2,3-dioxygenase-like lactoylglutathione lyase family enzyme